MTEVEIEGVKGAFRQFARRLTYGLAPLYGQTLGIPLVGTTLVPEGQALFMGPEGGRTIAVGIPSRNATEAALIVRDGLADVLTWLGQPIRPLALQVAERHYATEETP